MTDTKPPLKSETEWEETTGNMPIGEAFDAAKRVTRTDFFSHEAKSVSREEFVSAMEVLGIKTLLDAHKLFDDTLDDVECWPTVQKTYFPDLSQSINDALSAIGEYASELIGVECLGASSANLK